MKRTRYYNSTDLTTKKFYDVLARTVSKIEKNHRNNSDLVLASWPLIVGQKIATLTSAISFDEGILKIKVLNSTLLSLLSQKEKHWILKTLREKFPNVEINNIYFRMG